MTAKLRVEKLTKDAITLLEQERAAILKGDYAALETIGANKDAFLEQIEAAAQSLADAPRSPAADRQREEMASCLSIVSRRAAENQRLLSVARQGADSAKRRAAEILNGEPAMGVYAPDGGKIAAAAGGGGVKY